MAVAQSNSYVSGDSCNCFVKANLRETILDTKQVACFEERYELGEQLGWGQFGVIRSCSDKLTREILACKSIAKERLVTEEDHRSIKLEIEIMTRLSGHPNVVDLKAVYEDENYVHLVMELCAGGELFHRLEEHGRFSEFDARVLFKHLMLVVMYCHDNGVVHRDLKPENILLATKSSSSPIKLADFGLATYIKPGISLHGTVGSPFYIAPEVLAGGYNQAADVWSAGVILYILLSGMPPFWGQTKSRIFDSVRAANLRFPSDPWDNVSASAKELITSMLCTNHAQRLTAAKVLEHSWMTDCLQQAVKPYESEDRSCGQLDLGSVSFSTPLITKDISFGSESLTPFTCKSSFSSFMVGDATPCSVSGAFSFSSCCEANTLDLSSPVSTMPSFAFFGTGSPVEQVNTVSSFTIDTSTQPDGIRRDSSFSKFSPPLDTSIFETQKGGSRPMGIRSKRNRTIGLGEFEQLDLMVTESVIRWASCTHLPTATSLRSSLVC
ncbi:calcium/calmodulin-dependent protein kinase [Ranunculus cassubicifolius]